MVTELSRVRITSLKSWRALRLPHLTRHNRRAGRIERKKIPQSAVYFALEDIQDAKPDHAMWRGF
jgi:hypothetical protein